jgi:LEA14-like dessication related protein
MLRLVFATSLALALATGCHQGKPPELRVLGVQDTATSHVFVQVTNPARRPMKLTKLTYAFASASGATVSEGEMRLHREIPAGAVAVVEVPLEADATDTLMLRGTLTAELDQIVRSFKLNAEIQPH